MKLSGLCFMCRGLHKTSLNQSFTIRAVTDQVFFEFFLHVYTNALLRLVVVFNNTSFQFQSGRLLAISFCIQRFSRDVLARIPPVEVKSSIWCEQGLNHAISFYSTIVAALLHFWHENWAKTFRKQCGALQHFNLSTFPYLK